VADEITPSRLFPIPGYSGPIANHGGYNGGSDIFAAKGTPVVSMVNGVVEFVSTQQTAPTSGGNAVQIRGADGLNYYYAHFLNPTGLKVGDKVSAGQQIGQVDNSGNAATTASHLHIGIGHGISEGVGPAAGVGQNFNAADMLRSLVSDTRANNPNILDHKPAPPSIKFDPTVPGFSEGNQSGIYLNLQKAMQAGIDPFLWLAIVSKESNFNPNAVNPTSGACGYAQIYPCIPGLDPGQNIDEGLKRLKDFLHQCGDNWACALNKYSGGGGQAYIDDIYALINKLKSSNGDLPSKFDPNVDYGTNPNTSGGGSDTGSQEKCPPIILEVGPAKVPFPDVGCIIRTTVDAIVKQLTGWWQKWQVEHIPNWSFVLIGLVLSIVGLLMLANDSGVTSTVVTAIAPEAKAASSVAKAG
jgi:hypothetical protein